MNKKELEDLIDDLNIIHKCLGTHIQSLKRKLNEMESETKIEKIIKELKEKGIKVEE